MHAILSLPFPLLSGLVAAVLVLLIGGFIGTSMGQYEGTRGGCGWVPTVSVLALIVGIFVTAVVALGGLQRS